MTVYAIAEADGTLGSGCRAMRILKCPVQEHVGQRWATDQHVRDGEPYLIRFEPADQYCYIVDLAKGGDLTPRNLLARWFRAYENGAGMMTVGEDTRKYLEDNAPSLELGIYHEVKENLLRTVKHHRAHCDGPACNIQLFLLKKLALAAGLEFTDEESKLFF